MALRFRSLLPLAIPGVLALLGWWWFSSRKRERLGGHDRQDSAGVEGPRLGPPRKDSRPAEDAPSLPPRPLEAGRLPSPALPCKPVAGRRAPHPESVATEMTGAPSVPQDGGGDLEAVGSPGLASSRAPSSVLPRTCVAAGIGGDEVEGTLDSSPARPRGPRETPLSAGLPEPLGVETSEEAGKGTRVRSTASEAPLAEAQCLAAGALERAALPVSRSVPPGEAVPEGPPNAPQMEKHSGGAPGEPTSVAEGDATWLPSASLEFHPEEEEQPSGSAAKGVPTCQGTGEAGRRGGRESEQAAAVGLDKEEVKKMEQVAIDIISSVIRAATEEVLSGTVTDMSERIFQYASRVDKAESAKGGAGGAEETAPLGVTPLLEENVHRHTLYSSRLTHGLLARPGHGRPRQPERPAEASNHEEEFEDAQTVTEDSGCSACTSEDGVSAEDLLRSPPVPALEPPSQGPEAKDSQHGPACGRKPPSPPLGEGKIPYSNGVLREGSPHLRHEQSWQTEADADNSGGSDVNSMDSVDIGCIRKSEGCQKAKTGADSKNTELVIWEVEVPKHLVGRLIGKQGRYVSFLKQNSGAKIYISTLPYTQDFQICHIEGSQQNVDKALSLIGKKFKDLSLANIYTPPPPALPLHSLPMTSWLMLPDGVTVEVIVVNQVNAGHLFVQQHTHPTFHVLRSLDQQMYLCYSQPGIPTMPTPVEVGVVCAAPGVEGAWWRAQVVAYFKDSGEVEIRYVDYGGYERVKIDTLRQIRSDFVTLPFQGAEVLLDNVVPLPDDDHFSTEADTAVSEMTRGTPLLAQVTNYDSATGLPLIQLWSMIGDELVSINRTLVERGFAQWIESY